MAEALFGMVSHDAKTTCSKYWLSPSSIAYIKFLKSKSNAMAPGSVVLSGETFYFNYFDYYHFIVQY
jgi:hypothetical protein